MNKKDFLEQYILSRTSHKKHIQDLIEEAKIAWNAVNTPD